MRGRGVHGGPVNLQEQLLGVRADYSAAKSDRFKRRRSGLAVHGGSADWHYRSEGEYLRLLEIARDMRRNDDVVGAAVDRACTNIVQDGFRVVPETGDASVNEDLLGNWKDWAGNPDACDIQGERDFHEMEKAVMDAMLVDGDSFALPTRGGQLQLLEAHRARTPRNTKRNVVHGVLLDPLTRKRLEYWFTADEVNPLTPIAKVADMQAVAARNAAGERQVFHIYHPKRITQTRGVTALAPIVEAAGMFDDLRFATLVAAQIQSCFAILREREQGVPETWPASTGNERSEITATMSRLIEDISPGIEVTGAPGEKLTGFSPTVPRPEFFAHAKLLLQIVGINLGLPLALLMLDASETNFSGWRGAVDQARLGFRDNQRQLETRFHGPVWRWKCRQFARQNASLGRAMEAMGGAFFKARWNPPTWPYIEPMKDAAADLLKVRNGLISHRRLHAERGRDWEELAGEIVEDNAFAIRIAHKKAEELRGEGIEVDWRELVSLPTPDGVSVTIGREERGNGS